MLKVNLFKRIRVLALLPLLLADIAYAISSSNPAVMPNIGSPQGYQASVDTDMSNCSDYASDSYAFVFGIGGGNMKLQCPPNKPVMVYWQQEVGYGGFGVVTHGGGKAWIKCCPLKHTWQPTAPHQ